MSKEYNLDDRQKAMRLMEALSGVDGELLERSEGVRTVIPFWRYGKQLAACFALVVMGACAIGVYSVTGNNKNATGNAHNFTPQAMDKNLSMSGGSDGINADMAPKEDYQQAAESLEKVPAMENGKAAMEEQFTDASNSMHSMQGQSNRQDGLQMPQTEGVTNAPQEDKHVAVDSEKLESSPVDARAKITLQAAKEMERIGGYVPEKLPSGYQFESARGSSPANSYLDMSLCWCKGMDDIRLHITEFYAVASMPKDVYETFQKRIVDPAKPETYDVSLYEIPYADTVPREYFEVFDHPVFKESDFSLEMVEARMKSIPDAGDTDTPSGNYAELYDSGIMVEFSGRGSAEEIWEMFESIKP